MDNNLKEVLMAVIALISAIVTPLVVVYVTKKQNEKIDSNQVQITRKVDVVEKKLDDNHKQQNGNLTKLIETTAQLAEERGKQLGKEEQKNEESIKVQEAAPVVLPGATKLKIHEGEIKVTPSQTKKKP